MELETIIYYALQVKAWHLLVTKTFSETFIADLLLFKENGAQTWIYFFSNFAFLTKWEREIHNEEMECPQ